MYRNGRPTPEQQFVNALIDKKLEALQAMNIEEYSSRDYVLHVHAVHMPKLPNSTQDRLWRKVRVSGGLTLSVFVDKVFTPMFRFIRNLHAHVIHDLTDGALFGPKGCDAVDMMHLPQTGYGFIPDDDWQIVHIVREKGDTMCIQYDFGDNWYFDIKVEEVIPAEESTGAVVILGGSGTHPPAEVTPWHWADLLRTADKNNAGREETLREMFASMNYASLPYSSAYNLEFFSVEETQKAVSGAFDSPASLRSMSKHLNQDFTDVDDGGQSVRATLAEHNQTLRKGQALMTFPVYDADGNPTGRVVEEGVSESRRDNPSHTACANCGSPKNLKVCTGCRQRFFCSRSCLRTAWARGHREVCSGPQSK